MNFRVILLPDANADITSAVRWYEHKEPKLAFRFMIETQATLRRIERNPHQFPLVTDTVRRAVIKRFPYSIYFTLNRYAVFVIAVLHQYRADAVWRDRDNGHN